MYFINRYLLYVLLPQDENPGFTPIHQFYEDENNFLQVKMNHNQSAFKIAFINFCDEENNINNSCFGGVLQNDKIYCDFDETFSVDPVFGCDGTPNCPDVSGDSSAHFLYLDENHNCTYDQNWNGNLTGNSTHDGNEGQDGFNVGIVVGVSVPLCVVFILIYVAVLLMCGNIGLAETKAVIATLSCSLLTITVFALLSGLLDDSVGASVCLSLAVSWSVFAVAAFVLWTGVWEIHATRVIAAQTDQGQVRVIRVNSTAPNRSHTRVAPVLDDDQQENRPRDPSFPPTYDEALSHAKIEVQNTSAEENYVRFMLINCTYIINERRMTVARDVRLLCYDLQLEVATFFEQRQQQQEQLLYMYWDSL